ncbi:MMPL family transporter [Streptomyces niveiscabiei]|uniref:MMPL family transporter n=1 Tax=Streptomyces niveiscabiei TaxID=164115 RepID=UPI0029BAA719|nr:MMPL family transporter [Streptomyces niveiscabiei]MDX3386032.1 MMPL family transporter [Streptomyces niveiscabiei]
MAPTIRASRSRITVWVWAALTVISCALALTRLDSLYAAPARAANSPSDRAASLIARKLPRLGDEQLILAFTSPSLTTREPVYQDTVAAVARTLVPRPGVGTLLPVPDQPERDPRHAYVIVGLKGDAWQRQRLASSVQTEAQRVAQEASGHRISVSLTGLTTVNRALVQADEADLHRVETMAIPLVLLTLTIGLGSLGAALVPLLVAGVSVAVGLGCLAVLDWVTDVSTLMLMGATVVGYGLGLDYGLLVLIRYRRSRADGNDPRSAVAHASRSAGKAVTWCALAVIGSSAALLAVPLGYVRSLGLAVLLSTVVTYAVATTLLPAVLPRLDRLLSWATLPRLGRGFAVGSRWSERLARRPWLWLLGALALLLAAATPVVGLRLVLPVDRAAIAHSDAGRGLARMESDHFSGALGVALPHTPRSGPVDTTELERALRTDSRVAFTSVVDNGRDLTVLLVAQRVPVDSPAATAVIGTVRDTARRTLEPGQQVLVAGPTAALDDLRAALVAALWQVAALVLGASLLLLTFFFRSVLIPLKAIAVNLLSTAAAFGLLTLVWPDTGVSAVIPVLTFTIVFGLSLDYEIFLVHAITERYVESGDCRDAVVQGLRQVARPITLGAAALTIVFASLTGTGRLDFQQLGFAVAAAVVLDATLIRLMVVPALMHLMGRLNWWLPSWLAALLPPHRSAERADVPPQALRASTDPAEPPHHKETVR